MKHLYKVYNLNDEEFFADGEWFTKEEAKDYLLDLIRNGRFNLGDIKEKDASLNYVLDCCMATLWAYIVIERRTGLIINGCGIDGIHNLLREDSGYSTDDYMIQANFTFNK